MRFAALSVPLLVAACATPVPPAPPPEQEPPTVSIPSFWPLPDGTDVARCPTCGQPVPLVLPQPQTPPPVLDADEALRRASVAGKYRDLLRKVEVADDWIGYGAFCDWGYWSGTSYGGVDDLPPGFWVYVHPHWYVWREGDSMPSAR